MRLCVLDNKYPPTAQHFQYAVGGRARARVRVRALMYHCISLEPAASRARSIVLRHLLSASTIIETKAA
jgi:hypothetical protein